jgi:hypothetical protein
VQTIYSLFGHALETYQAPSAVGGFALCGLPAGRYLALGWADHDADGALDPAEPFDVAGAWINQPGAVVEVRLALPGDKLYLPGVVK